MKKLIIIMAIVFFPFFVFAEVTTEKVTKADGAQVLRVINTHSIKKDYTLKQLKDKKAKIEALIADAESKGVELQSK